MKKLCFIIISIIVLFSLSMTIFASRMCTVMPGNDDPSVAPVGYVYYKFDTGVVGTYNQLFDAMGNPNSTGPISITMTIENDLNNYTKVSWESNIPIYSVIVKGGPNYNQCFYSPPATSDTDLTAPVNPTNGLPYNVSHVSFIFLPMTPPSPTPTVTASPTIQPTSTPIVPTPTCPPKPPCSILSFIIIIVLIFLGLLLLAVAAFYLYLYCKKHKHCCKKKKPPRN